MLRAFFVALPVFVLAAPPALAQPAHWRQKWDSEVAAARQEGEVVIAGPPGSLWRNAIMQFQKAYPGIRVSYNPFHGRDFWARFVKEREVGQYDWDIRLGGYDALENRMKDEGKIAPVRSMLVLPEVTDNSRWHGGLDALFMDNQKRYVLGFLAMQEQRAYYNKKFITDPAVADIKDIVNPKWRGKISMDDPRAGTAMTNMGGLYWKFGPSFIRKLIVDQKPVIVDNSRQQLDWLLAGRYPIAFGLYDDTSSNTRVGEAT